MCYNEAVEIYYWDKNYMALMDMYIDGAWDTLVHLNKMSNLQMCIGLDFITGEVDYHFDCDCDL